MQKLEPVVEVDENEGRRVRFKKALAVYFNSERWSPNLL